MNTKIFISHSSADKRFVRTLKDDLQENGISTWFDEDELDYGDSLISKLDSAIQSSSHFLVILSPNSIESQWVKYELTKASLLRTQSLINAIIPIKYRECQVPETLSGLLYADLSKDVVMRADDNKVKFTTDGYATFFTKLIKSIRSKDKELSVKSIQEIGATITDKEVDGVSAPRPRLDIEIEYKNGQSFNLGILSSARPSAGENFFRTDETPRLFELIRNITVTLVNNSDAAALYPKIFLHPDSIKLNLAPLNAIYPIKAHEVCYIECYYSEKEEKLPLNRTRLKNFPSPEQKASVNLLVEYQDSNHKKWYTTFQGASGKNTYHESFPTEFLV